MNGLTKFIIGGVATSLMAMAAHSTVSGAAFVDELQAKASAKVAEIGLQGVEASLVRAPMLTRDVVLTGEASQSDKDRLIAALKAIPGIGSVSWAGSADDVGSSPPPTAAPAPATPEAVTNCQEDVNGAIAEQSIQFDTGQATIQVSSDALLDNIAERLKACAGAVVEVAGHTDAQGAADANMALSDQRARSVAAALISRGVPADRLQARGYGETRPKVQTGADEANASNRRIEFQVSSAATAAPAR